MPSVATARQQLAAQETHTYRAELEARVWRFVVDQHGVDTVVSFVLPDRSELGPFNSPTGRRGAEAFLIVLNRAGSLRFSIRSKNRSSAGDYTVLVEPVAGAAAELRSPSQQKQVLAESMATAAARSYAAGGKADAREQYVRALSSWPDSDPTGRGRTLVALANLARFSDAPEEAAELLARALPIWRSLGDRTSEATTLNRLGLALDKTGETTVARQHLERSLQLWQELQEPLAEVPVRINLCLTLQRQGDFIEARDCYLQARNLVRDLQQPSREAVVVNNLAGVYWKLGEPDRALALYDELLAPKGEHLSDALRAQALSNRALIYNNLGEAEQALFDFGQALAVFRRLDRDRDEANVLNQLGMTYLSLGEFDRAQTFLEQSLSLFEAGGNRRAVAGTWRGLGRSYSRQGKWDAAFVAYAAALSLSRELEDRRGEATLLKLLGQAHAESGGLRRAAVELQRAHELLHKLGDRRQEAQALLELGKVHHLLQDPDRALELQQRAHDLFRDLRDRTEQVKALEALANAERDRGRLAQALAHTSTAVDLLEDLRTKAGGLRQRAAFLATRRGVYELQIDLLMQQHRRRPELGYDHRAFALSERSRSRAILDLIQAEAKINETLQRGLRAATRRLATHTERQLKILGRQHEASEAVAADRAVVDALTELERLRAAARRQDPGYGEQLRGDTLSLAQVADLLDPGTLLLEFLLAEPRSYLWVIGRERHLSFELPSREHLETLARQAHADLSTLDLRTGRTARKSVEELSHLLIGPMTNQLEGAERLVVVADGALSYLPFAALTDPNTGEPLVVHHDVVHLASATTLDRQRRHLDSAATSKTLAVLADPVFTQLDPRLTRAGVTDSEVDDVPADFAALARSGLGNLNRLPATDQEAKAIAALVDVPGQSLIALGFDAHRDRILSGELADYRYLHFATHGLINARQPDLSGLALAAFDAEGRSRNGFLGMDDLYGLELGAEMVVLSGCQTAWGKEIRGEGLLGLTRGFMAAGVPKIVASLWPVQDKATAELMADFYRGVLDRGEAPAAALAAAQRSIRERRPWSDPFFWSAFVHFGDWQ